MTGCIYADVVVAWGSLGRLKPDDVPVAAVDFHISSILEGLLSDANMLGAARKAAVKVGSEPAGALKSAMWHFSGSCNHRSLLQVCQHAKAWMSRVMLRHPWHCHETQRSCLKSTCTAGRGNLWQMTTPEKCHFDASRSTLWHAESRFSFLRSVMVVSCMYDISQSSSPQPQAAFAGAQGSLISLEVIQLGRTQGRY